MRSRVVSAAALLAAMPGLSLALGLGDETVRSYLNAPLNAEIELIATPEELSTLRVQLAPREEFIRHGLDYPAFLTGIQLRAERLADGRNVIRMTSAQPVHGVQLADLGEREAEELEALDEAQALDLVGTVDAPAAGPAPHAGQEPELLVVADGPRREPRLRADLPDRHAVRRRLPAHVNWLARRLRSVTGEAPLDNPARRDT